ncbi:MAG: endonuclease domain-containing protein [Janthinobacterium lividum]
MHLLLAFLVIGLIVWLATHGSRTSAKPESRSIDKPDARFHRRANVTVETKKWRETFMADCESPAETAFLEAMIAGFRLVPGKGLLQGPSMSLNLQVEIGRYRVDFFVNGWLVIEVDGAAYHSSPEAMARDLERDRFMEDAGYTVLRIPAKVVFNKPQEAVAAVQAALGRNAKPAPVQEVAKRQTVGEMFNGATKALSDLNAEMDRSLAVSEAMNEARKTFNAEKSFIEKAIEIAERHMVLEAYRSKSDLHRESYDRNLASMMDAVDKSQAKAESSRPAVIEPIKPIDPPARHASVAINEAIQANYRSLVQERSTFFKRVHFKLLFNAGLSKHVRQALFDMSHPECWTMLIEQFSPPETVVKSMRVTSSESFAVVNMGNVLDQQVQLPSAGHVSPTLSQSLTDLKANSIVGQPPSQLS